MIDRIRLQSLLDELDGYGARLVAVSKTQPAEAVTAAYGYGQRDFGENYVKELLAKQAGLPADIRWHFIGHLQTNKVKSMLPHVSLVQSVDSIRLLEEIDRQAVRLHLKVSCLLQVHIAEEETKFGLAVDEAEALVDAGTPATLSAVTIRGLMGMASLTGDNDRVRQEFRGLKRLFDRLAPAFPRDGTDGFDILSMGMTGDYRIALDEGSTMVRIGSAIFGERERKG